MAAIGPDTPDHRYKTPPTEGNAQAVKPHFTTRARRTSRKSHSVAQMRYFFPRRDNASGDHLSLPPARPKPIRTCTQTTKYFNEDFQQYDQRMKHFFETFYSTCNPNDRANLQMVNISELPRDIPKMHFESVLIPTL